MTDLYCKLLGRMCVVKLYSLDIQVAVLGDMHTLVVYFTHFRLWPSCVASGQCMGYSSVTLNLTLNDYSGWKSLASYVLDDGFEFE